MDFLGEDTTFFMILVGIIIVLIIVLVVGINHHIHKAPFKPKFKKLSDGSLQMEFDGFGGIQTSRTKRFLEEYKEGMKVEYQGKMYEIEEIKEQSEVTVTRTDRVMVCYLREVE
jgi:hypothetical protein